MDLTKLAEKIQTSLLNTNTEVSRLETERVLLETQHREEEDRLDSHFLAVMARLETARNSIRLRLKEEVDKVAKIMSDKEHQARSSCLLLESELDNIQHLVSDRGKGLAMFDMSSCMDRCKQHMEDQQDFCFITPRFQPSAVLGKVRPHDFGFIQLAEFLPKDFPLELSTPMTSIITGDKVVCEVVTNKQFTSRIQSNLKFGIKRDLQTVSFEREECQVSKDLKSFTVVFLVDLPGVYTVTVQLYNQNVPNSPLLLHIKNGDLTDTQNARHHESEFKNKPLESVNISLTESPNNAQGVKEENTNFELNNKLVEALPDQKQETAHHTDVWPDQKAVANQFPRNGSRLPEVGSESTLTTHLPPDKSANTQLGSPTLPPLRRPGQQRLPDRADQSGQDTVTRPSAPLTVTISHQQDSRKVTSKQGRSNVVSQIAGQSWLPSKPLPEVDFIKLINLAIPLPKVTMVLEGNYMVLDGASNTHDSRATVFRPIGICLLPDKRVVVASTFEDKVKMFSPSGKFLKQLVLGGRKESFKRPSDMVTLRSGDFVVRDNNGIRFFNNNGDFIMTLKCDHINRSYGLAEDGNGLLVIINESKGNRGGTGVGTDLLFFEVKTGELVKRIELSDVIRDKKVSKCRFLTFALGKLYITDLGLDCVYTLDPETRDTTVFGQSGSGPDCFSDPAGLVVDSLGNMLVADSRNHRICLYSRTNRFLGEVRLVPGARRPSGLLLDRDNGDLYLLNLAGDQSVIRYSLQ